MSPRPLRLCFTRGERKTPRVADTRRPATYGAPVFSMVKWKAMARRLCIIFAVAFLLNLAWENLHEVLYMHYQGGEITRLILLRAALFDAAFITTLAAPFLSLSLSRLRVRLWLFIIPAVLFAVGLEWWALETGRWEYTVAMPLIPFLAVGLSPTVQLAFTGWLALLIARK